MKYPIEYTKLIDDPIEDMYILKMVLDEKLPAVLPYLNERRDHGNYITLRERSHTIRSYPLRYPLAYPFLRFLGFRTRSAWVEDKLWRNYQLPFDPLVRDLVLRLCIETKFQWESNTILNVYFFPGVTRGEQNNIIDKANEWNNHCNVSFVKTNDPNESDIRVSFLHFQGNWACIGKAAARIHKNENTMNLTPSCFKNDNEFNRAILHEFGHVLGLVHEHQSPLAKVTWDKKLVYHEMYRENGWSKREVKENIFKEYKRSGTNYSDELDPDSIMAYSIPSLYTKERIEFRRNYELSEMDKKYIGIFYPKH